MLLKIDFRISKNNRIGWRAHLGVLQLAATLAALLQALLVAGEQEYKVNRGTFKTCNQSGFCLRNREFRNNRPTDLPTQAYAYSVTSGISVDENSGTLVAQVTAPPDLTPAEDAAKPLHLRIQALADGAVNVHLSHDSNFDTWLKHKELDLRVSPSNAPAKVKLVKNEIAEAGKTIVAVANTQISIEIAHRPLKIDFVREKTIVATFNGENLLRYERGGVNGMSSHPDPSDSSKSPNHALDPRLHDIYSKGAFSEHFGGINDPKAHGPRSIAFDFTFPNTSIAYGLAEHTSPLNLPSTYGFSARYTDPYRLYNLDVCNYELDNPMSIYGNIPFLQTTVPGSYSAGIYLLSVSELWVDVAREPTSASMDLKTHWMAETGTLDLYVIIKNTPSEVHETYLGLTGDAMLPPLAALGYHQCRWNYDSFADVEHVNAMFDSASIPYDYIWLDIDHTIDRKYFTWKPKEFSAPESLLKRLDEQTRKMVTINDPHIKDESSFSVFSALSHENVLVKTADGDEDFKGHCWPGTSVWVDYVLPKGREQWAAQYRYEKYVGSARNLHSWNDMNEPSVFSGPEITMPKNLLHANGKLEHREIHNLYGMLMHRSTFEGLITRDVAPAEINYNPKYDSELKQRLLKSVPVNVQNMKQAESLERPFVLSRAFFAGTQRYGAIWTGDNLARWPHLKVTIPMLLSLSVCGISFAGADIGGFFSHPTPELMTRWYFAASLTPFFRSHAHEHSPRREPWLFSTHVGYIRDAVDLRYTMLPTIYTLYAAATYHRQQIMKPLAFAFPNDDHAAKIDEAFMLGNSGILVAPVLDKGRDSVSVYLPKLAPGGTRWFEIDVFSTKSHASAYADHERQYTESVQGSHVSVHAPIHRLPVFVAGGSIFVTREVLRRTVLLTHAEPLAIHVALDSSLSARGEFYYDDGVSYAYALGAHAWYDIEFNARQLRMRLRSGKEVHAHAQVPRVKFLRIVIRVPLDRAETILSGITSAIVKIGSESGVIDNAALVKDIPHGILVVKVPAQLLTPTTHTTEWSVEFVGMHGIDKRH